MTVSFLDIGKGNGVIYSFSLSLAFEVAGSDVLTLRSYGDDWQCFRKAEVLPLESSERFLRSSCLSTSTILTCSGFGSQTSHQCSSTSQKLLVALQGQCWNLKHSEREILSMIKSGPFFQLVVCLSDG